MPWQDRQTDGRTEIANKVSMSIYSHRSTRNVTNTQRPCISRKRKQKRSPFGWPSVGLFSPHSFQKKTKTKKT